ncbi:MAG: HEPN domain-containing protein [Candidatus Brocadia sp.]|nr:HEPN domain-containing protein [Candidatus Brocadia sp.]MDG6026843.1 HEPN domain-containing protein [Candidatus Brocadia sp.]
MNSTTKALIIGYVQKANKKVGVAEKLLKSGDYEDAVSRAYYAVFHATQALLLTEGERAETHKGIVTLFGLLFVKTGKFSKHIGKYLANLKDDRESGDYEVFSYIDKETAETAISESKEFLKETKLYLEGLGITF